jgi:hypothetical protein
LMQLHAHPTFEGMFEWINAAADLA